MLHGVVVALLTPETEIGKIDIESGVKLANYAVENGVNGLFVLGTNGEGVRFSTEERIKFARAVINGVDRKKADVCIQTGSNSLEETIALSQAAVADGADCIAVMTPYMLCYDEEATYDFYKAVSGALPKNFPIYLYNIPQRTGNDISGALCSRLISECENIVGIKYSFNDLNRTMEYLEAPNASVLHGSDIYQLQYVTMGCDGVISGLAGVCPTPFCKVRDYLAAGDIENARKWQKICFEVGKVLMFGNISIMKDALRLLGFKFGGKAYLTGAKADKFKADFKKTEELIASQK